jgi:hypothetical protein
MRLLSVCLWLMFAVACSAVPEVSSTEQALCPTCAGDNPPCCCQSPIVIDVAGDGIRLTSWANGVAFALRPGYQPSARAWTEPNSDDAWLVLDRNGDGIICRSAPRLAAFRAV